MNDVLFVFGMAGVILVMFWLFGQESDHVQSRYTQMSATCDHEWGPWQTNRLSTRMKWDEDDLYFHFAEYTERYCMSCNWPDQKGDPVLKRVRVASGPAEEYQ